MSDCINHTLSIGHWNICGAENKISQPDVIKFLQKHHIIVLCETFLESNSIHLEGYKCLNVFRTGKRKNATRNYAGISVLTKTNLSPFIKIAKITKEDFIWIRISKLLTGYSNDTFCCCAYIPPKGSPYYKNNPDLDLFGLLSDDISTFSKLGHIMVTGDLNANIGLKPETVTADDFNAHANNIISLDEAWAPRRCSTDVKSNQWGNKLIEVCTAHNICLLNGRKLGDLDGRCTYFGRNASVIDVSIVDRHIFSHTIGFKVHPLTEHSDHCRIETILACKPHPVSSNDTCVDKLIFDKYIWNQSTSPEKLNHAMSDPFYNDLKNKILSSNYPSSSAGCNKLCEDVSKLTKFLHEKSCEKRTIGKKSRAKAKRQKFFTPNCQEMRQRVRRAANFWYRNPFKPMARAEYFSLLRQYKKLVKKLKKEHLQKQLNQLISCLDTNEMWNILSDIKGKKSGAPIPISDLHSHFSSILNDVPKNVSESKLNSLQEKILSFRENKSATTDSVSVPIANYSPLKLCKLAKKLKNGKSTFKDGFVNEVIKFSINDMSPVFVKLFNLIENSGSYPSAWNTSFLVPLHKSGCKSDPDNFRGLAVGSNVSKFYSLCLYDKLINFVESNNLLSPQQFGFRENFRTNDAMFVLRSLISAYKNRGSKPVYSCFVDFSKAFDSVDRTALAYKLGNIGIRGSLLDLVISMYEKTDYIIKSNGQFSVPFSSKFGVKQGCNLSPLFFNIFINDIHEIFDKSCEPLKLDDWLVNSLSYADDLVLLSETESGLQSSLNKLENYCNQWGLKVNIKKTKILVFNKPFNSKIKKLNFSIDQSKIVVTNSYCYLGVDITNTGSFLNATNSLYKKALRALYSIYSSLDVRSNVANSRLFLKLFDSLVQPILLYGCDIWGSHCLNSSNKVLTLVNKFYKTLIGAKSRCSNSGVFSELGRYPIEINIAKAMTKFWFRLISLPKSRLSSHCYWFLHKTVNLNDSWFDAIKIIINTTGQYHIWNNQTDLINLPQFQKSKIQNYVIQTLKDVYTQSANAKINSESKLYLFKNGTNPRVMSKYLCTLYGRDRRRVFANFRLGTFDLELEKGRHFGIPRESRICKICNTKNIENEDHFLFSCPPLSLTRNLFIQKISNIHENFSKMSSSEKISFLFFNDELDNDTERIAADFLLALEKRKNFLIKLQSVLLSNRTSP